ncbi:MAG: hypothetical protein HDT32_04890 [Clostridiales bacterium]|nr:hypothetical protein [Clostridiales bacterium]
MKWFYKLKRNIRIIITVAVWVLFFIVTSIIGNSLGDNTDNMPLWQAIIVLLLLAVATAVTVFAVKARRLEVKATTKQDEKIKNTIAKDSTPSDLGVKLNYDADLSNFSDTPDIVVTLIGNRNEEMQSNIIDCKVGDDVAIEYGIDKDLYLCSVDGGDIGYLPEKVSDDMQGSLHLEVADISQDDDTDVYSIKVAIYRPRRIQLPLKTKVVGVSFDDRQDCIKESKVGDPLTIKHTPLDKYPEASIIVNDRTGKTLGSVKSELSHAFLGEFGDGFVLCGKILDITGGTDGKEYVGCNIKITDVAK